MSVSPGGAEVPHIPMEECVTGGAASDRLGTLFGNCTLDENNYAAGGDGSRALFFCMRMSIDLRIRRNLDLTEHGFD